MARLVITQSNYIPWKGYFDLIAAADTCLLYDSVQYTKQDWRNRNLIKTGDHTTWLTIPVVYRTTAQRICDTEIADGAWARKHWHKIMAHYAHAPCFAEFAPAFEALYRACATEKMLSAVNASFIAAINGMLGIGTPVLPTPDFARTGEKNADLITLCQMHGADRYLVGPKAKAYIDEAQFARAGITVEWMSYEGYPDYAQAGAPFLHHVSVVDLLFNTGARARDYMLHTR